LIISSERHATLASGDYQLPQICMSVCLSVCECPFEEPFDQLDCCNQQSPPSSEQIYFREKFTNFFWAIVASLRNNIVTRFVEQFDEIIQYVFYS